MAAWLLDFSPSAFMVVWLSDHTTLEAHGSVRLIGLHPMRYWGKHRQRSLETWNVPDSVESTAEREVIENSRIRNFADSCSSQDTMATPPSLIRRNKSVMP